MTFIQKLMKKRLGNERGVTLIELLAVVVILGIIAAIAAPIVINETKDAQTKSDQASTAIIIEAAERYLLDGGATTGTLDTTNHKVTIAVSALTGGGYLKSVPANTNLDTVAVTYDTANKNVIGITVE